MGLSFFNTKPKNTYHGLLKTTDHLPITEMRRMTDGVGNDTPLWISPSEIMSTGNFRVYSEQSGIPVRHIIDSVDSLTPKIFSFRTTNKQRWAIRVDGQETGSSSGSDFYIRRYDDSGAFIDAPFTINRKNGTIGIGTAPTIAKMTIRGDGTNPIFRTEHTDGTFRFINTPTYSSVNVSSGGSFYVMPNESLAGGPGFQILTQAFGGTCYIRYAGDRYEIGHIGGNTGGFGMQFTMRTALANTASGRFNFATAGGVVATTGTMYGINFTDTFAAAAGSANYRPLSINYTINNSGAQTGTMTGIYLNATETNLNGMTHNLMDLQVGGSSRARISNSGNLTIGTSASITARLGVRGDGTNPIARFENNAANNGVIISADGLSILPITANVTSLGSSTLAYSNLTTSQITFTSANNYITMASISGGASMSINIGYGNNSWGFANAFPIVYKDSGASNGFIGTSGNNGLISINTRIIPTSGNADFSLIQFNPTINQTGTANGITRGLFINPTLTSAVDFRAIEVMAGSTSAHKLLLLTNGSGSKVIEANGGVEIGFFGSTPIAQPSITGSRANPEQALFSLLKALSNYGLIKDLSTT